MDFKDSFDEMYGNFDMGEDQDEEMEEKVKNDTGNLWYFFCLKKGIRRYNSNRWM